MFWRCVAVVVGALLLCGCQTQRNGLDYTAMTQKMGPPKPGHGRVVMLRERSLGDIVDSAWAFQLDGTPIPGLRAGTYVYADRPAGQHKLTASEPGFPGVTEQEISIQSGRTHFYVVRFSDRKNAYIATAGQGLLGLALTTVITSAYKNPGPLDFHPLEETAAKTTIAELRLGE